MLNDNYYDLPNRHSMRLQSYDYRQPGYYYVTICVAQRQCLLSNIVDAQVQLNTIGSIVEDECKKLSNRFQHVRFDQYVIMPNHFHGIILFEGPSIPLEDTATSRPPDRFIQFVGTTNQMHLVVPGILHDRTKNKELPTLGEVIRTFKAACTFRVRKTVTSDFAWEGRLYEHVIRNNSDLTRIRNYIINNPVTWHEDILHQP